MTRVLRIVREGQDYRICSIEVCREREEYYEVNQVPKRFPSPLRAVIAMEKALDTSEPDSISAKMCADCLHAYAVHGAITEADAIYALVALNDDILPLDEDVPDLLGEFLEKRHVVR